MHISRAVTSHGFALNVNTNLDYFKLIVPCGISDKPVTSLEQEMAQSPISRDRKVPALEDLAQQVARNFGRVFEAQTLWLESLDALFTASVRRLRHKPRQPGHAGPRSRSDCATRRRKRHLSRLTVSLNAGANSGSAFSI